MGYYIQNTDSYELGFNKKTERETMRFMDHMANKLSKYRIGGCRRDKASLPPASTSYIAEMKRLHDSAYITEMKLLRDAVLSAKEFEGKKEALLLLLKGTDCPFNIDIDYGEVGIEYDLRGHDYWREDDTEEVLRAIAPYLKKGSWIGFVGEDLSIWTYIFNGEGSFDTVWGSINWTGRPYADEGGDAR